MAGAQRCCGKGPIKSTSICMVCHTSLTPYMQDLGGALLMSISNPYFSISSSHTPSIISPVKPTMFTRSSVSPVRSPSHSLSITSPVKPKMHTHSSVSPVQSPSHTHSVTSPVQPSTSSHSLVSPVCKNTSSSCKSPLSTNSALTTSNGLVTMCFYWRESIFLRSVHVLCVPALTF